MKHPIPRKAAELKTEAFNKWTRDLDFRAEERAKFLESYASPDNLCRRLREEMPKQQLTLQDGA